MIEQQWGHFLVGIRVQDGSSGAGVGYSLGTVMSRELPRWLALASLVVAVLGGAWLAYRVGPFFRSSSLIGASFQSGDQTSSF